MRYRAPRCIAMSVDERRCSRKAGKRSGNIYVCPQHATLWTMLLIDDMLSPPTRHMLAFARWETARDGQRLIRSMRHAVAA